jgi:hypothetical protein
MVIDDWKENHPGNRDASGWSFPEEIEWQLERMIEAMVYMRRVCSDPDSAYYAPVISRQWIRRLSGSMRKVSTGLENLPNQNSP